MARITLDPSFDALLDRLRQSAAPKRTWSILKYLYEHGETPAEEVLGWFDVSESSAKRYEKVLLKARALSISVRWDDELQTKRDFWAVNLSPTPETIAS